MDRTERMGGAVLLLMMGVGVAGPKATEAGTLQRVKLTQAVSSLSFLPIDVARANKYFEEEGIGLEVIVTQGDGPNVQALLAKDVDFSASAPHHLYRLYLEGKPLLGVVNILNRCVINFVMHKEVAKERGITAETPLPMKLRALKGLTIGATRPGALTYHLAAYFTKKAGYTPQRDVNIIGAGAGPTLLAALENRKVDVMATRRRTPSRPSREGRGGKVDPRLLVAAVGNIKNAVRVDGRLTETGSDAFQDVLLAAGTLRQRVPFPAVFTNAYLP